MEILDAITRRALTPRDSTAYRHIVLTVTPRRTQLVSGTSSGYIRLPAVSRSCLQIDRPTTQVPYDVRINGRQIVEQADVSGNQRRTS